MEGVYPKKALLVFDKAIAPILFYGAELWGHSMVDSIERVQLSLPMCVQYQKKCIKYWLKLIEMSTPRYPFACYKMLKELDDNGRHTWASNVRILLSRYGFGHVWLNQGVGDPIRFIKEFYQRICDCATQEWNTHTSEYSKLALYNEVKTELGYESYLSNINVKKFRAALCRLRCSCHGLMIEIGRYENIAKENRICQ